jgi:hypothetical protein
MWDDLLRVAASVQGGHATAALVVGKLCSSKRQQNALTSAIKEYGALRRTVYAARYLADETYRRRIARQLNKGENLHALRRSLAYAGAGAVRRRHHEQQTEQMWCLTLATNAIVTWTTEYHGLAVAALRRGGRWIDDEVLAHIWPTHHDNYHYYGTHPHGLHRRRAGQARRRRVPAAARHALNCRPPVRGRRGRAMRRSTGVMLADVSDTSELDASVLVAEVVGLLNEAECYIVAPEDEQLEYLHRRAALLHRLVDVLGDEPSRSLAQDAGQKQVLLPAVENAALAPS